jgi:hypothetical protein
MGSVPEPPPKCAGSEVTTALIDWLREIHAPSVVINLIYARHEYGVKKYGQGLMTEDGRDSFEDARQEAGDLLQYLYKAKMQGLRDPTSVKEIQDVLAACFLILTEIK